MIRATTPTHIFELDLDRNYIDKMNITYSQGEKPNNRIILEKTEVDVTFNEEKTNECSITLTREESLLFDPEESIDIQIVVLAPNGRILASDEIWVACEDLLNPEVFKDEV